LGGLAHAVISLLIGLSKDNKERKLGLAQPKIGVHIVEISKLWSYRKQTIISCSDRFMPYLQHFLCYHNDTMTRRRLVLYILLNAFVTLLVAGAFLYIFNRGKLGVDFGKVEALTPISTIDINAEIVSVTGAGLLASESVILQNNYALPLILTGWTLKNNQGSAYTFPNITLYPGGTVKVHSGSGLDSAADLYWQRSEPVWKSGDLVSLYDPQNIARAFYRVP
jgi:hypothetical protein